MKKKLEDLRKAKGWDRWDCVVAIRMEVRRYAQIETGLEVATAWERLQIARGLGVDPSVIEWPRGTSRAAAPDKYIEDPNMGRFWWADCPPNMDSFLLAVDPKAVLSALISSTKFGSASKFADAAGLPVSSITDVIAGRQPITDSFKIASLLDLPDAYVSFWFGPLPMPKPAVPVPVDPPKTSDDDEPQQETAKESD